MTEVTKKATHMPWWHQYHDPTLNQLIARGLRYNNNLQTSMANIEAAQGELKRVKLNWIPTITGNVGYSSFPYLGFTGVLLTAVPNYTINIFSQIKEQQRANHELRASKAMRDGVKLTVIAQIAGSYFSHLAQTEELHLLQKVDRDLSESLTIYEATYQYGITTKLEVAKAKSELALIKSEEDMVKKNLVFIQNALRYLMNQNPCPFKFTQRFSQVDSHNMVIGTLPLQVIEHRPDMRIARHELKATRAGIGVALSTFLPSLNLSMARGDIATIPNGYTLGMPIYFNQAILSPPLLTMASFGELDKARGKSKAAYHRYIDTLRKALRDVDSDLSAHQFFTERLDKTVAAKEAVHEAYNLNKGLYHQGILSYLRLLEEKVKLDEINILVNQRKIEQTITIINLYQDLAVGYGYQPKHCCSNSSGGKGLQK